MESTYSWIDYAPQRDAELLDSYSRTITGVVGQVAESVVHIQVMKPVEERAGGRPGGLVVHGCPRSGAGSPGWRRDRVRGLSSARMDS
ncbi:hypothetical protein ACQ86N_46090 [Puia sp. P3]|uniref:hypothetical protein n=1 Tax=Puia sp. P3 TaxID=3423952 RepID=UPI003D67F4AB